LEKLKTGERGKECVSNSRIAFDKFIGQEVIVWMSAIERRMLCFAWGIDSKDCKYRLAFEVDRRLHAGRKSWDAGGCLRTLSI
jgi:hypothetical protein